jgi:hypothetical protein
MRAREWSHAPSNVERPAMGEIQPVRALLLLALTLATGCGVSTEARQCRIDTAVLCPGDFVGYSCQGESKPSPTCGAGTLEDDGEIGYCCAVQNGGTCVVDAGAGCTDGSTGD